MQPGSSWDPWKNSGADVEPVIFTSWSATEVWKGALPTGSSDGILCLVAAGYEAEQYLLAASSGAGWSNEQRGTHTDERSRTQGDSCYCTKICMMNGTLLTAHSRLEFGARWQRGRCCPSVALSAKDWDLRLRGNSRHTGEGVRPVLYRLVQSVVNSPERKAICMELPADNKNVPKSVGEIAPARDETAR